MPTELVKRINLDYLYPVFLARLLDCLAECSSLGADYVVYSGFRAFDEQKKLWDAFVAGAGPRAARPGASAHNYGLAVDCALRLPPRALSWDKHHYNTLLKVLPNHGLKSGQLYNDLPHINFPQYENATQLLPLKQILLNTAGSNLVKLKTVWGHIDGL